MFHQLTIGGLVTATKGIYHRESFRQLVDVLQQFELKCCGYNLPSVNTQLDAKHIHLLKLLTIKIATVISRHIATNDNDITNS